MSAGRGRGRGSGLLKDRPREPKSSTVSSVVSTLVPQPGASAVTPPARKKSFPESAVYAKEFIPRSATPSSISSVSAQTKEPKSSRLTLDIISQSTKRLKDRNPVNSYDIEVVHHLEECVCILASYNDSFDDVMEQLVQTLKAWMTEGLLEYVVERLFEEAVCNPNFRYIGVRMCDYIDQRVTLKASGNVRFRSIFLKKCQVEHMHFQTVENQQNERARWFGFALFVGEVYRQVQLRGKPYAVMGRACMDNIEKLLKDGQPDALFVAFSLFKLTGNLIDENGTLDHRMDDSVREIQKKLDALDETLAVHRQLQEVGKRSLRLRACNWNWGGSPAVTTAQQTKKSPAPSRPLVRRNSGESLSSLPIDRRPQAMAPAEAAAIDPSLYYNWEYCPEGLEHYPDPDEWDEYSVPEYGMEDDWYPPAEMSDEVEAAFEQFLQEKEGGIFS